jgi:hypothetical protein
VFVRSVAGWIFACVRVAGLRLHLAVDSMSEQGVRMFFCDCGVGVMVWNALAAECQTNATYWMLELHVMKQSLC